MLGSSYYNQHIMFLLYIFMIPQNIQLTSNPHSNMFNKKNTRKFTQKRKKKVTAHEDSFKETQGEPCVLVTRGLHELISLHTTHKQA
jgi:hypothetical protein